ncbi:hypothetical protein WJX74_000992 [Apatococcus lobatus]|uniref:Protein SirB1 N-terminal domain-containing protein n=1 Tax=Apatococcus lobatus TaxID=904363 RepID=A0AAW1RRZ8_9CHLO
MLTLPQPVLTQRNQPNFWTTRRSSRCRAAETQGGSDWSMSELTAATRRVQALEAYQQHMQRPDGEIDLLECSLLISQHAHPMLELETCRTQIAELAAGVRAQLPEQAYPMRIMQTISHHLFAQQGFRGNRQDYYSPENSYINCVLERRKGLPITLSLVYMEVAKQLGLSMRGVQLPAHFMIAPEDQDLEILVDPFNGGEICFVQDAEQRLGTIYGFPVRIDPAFVHSRASKPTTRQFLVRLLSNLRLVYQGLRMPEPLLAIIRYLRATQPESTDNLRDEALCLFSLERFRESASALQDYLEREPSAKDRPKAETLLRQIFERIDKAHG